jgi:hypothetical protein
MADKKPANPKIVVKPAGRKAGGGGGKTKTSTSRPKKS